MQVAVVVVVVVVVVFELKFVVVVFELLCPYWQVLNLKTGT